jgi:hypothetical protein
VRFAAGAQIYDGRRVWELVRDGATGMAVHERVSGKGHALDLHPRAAPRLLGLRRGDVWLDADGVSVACPLEAGPCTPSPLPETGPLEHPGPGSGFRVALARGEVRLFLPQDADPAGIALASGVARLLSVTWVHGGGGAGEQMANRTFRGRARVHALPHPVTLDGDLADWPEAAPLVVEAPWQLQSGADQWTGIRDASFSVAAAWTSDSICFAGRTRDDDRGPADTLEIHLDTVRLVLPLGDTGTPDAGTPDAGTPDATPAAARVVPGWLGSTFEACIPTAAFHARAKLPFAVSMSDVDGERGATRLSTAPEEDGVPLGELSLNAPP